MSGPSERDEVAEVLAAELHKACPFDNDHIARLANYETGATVASCPECYDMALIVAGTDWLAERYRRVAAEALREAADLGPINFAMTHETPKWRGYNHLVTTDWLRDRADRIEADR